MRRSGVRIICWMLVTFALAAAPAAAAPPVLVAPPDPGFIVHPGDGLVCGLGSWQPQPTGFAWQWFRNGVPVSTSQFYSTTVADLGTLTCRVTASIGVDSATADSLPVYVIPVAAPQVFHRPEARPAYVGLQGHCVTDDWFDPTAFVAVTFAWTRDGAPVAGATTPFRTFVPGDLGHVFTCVATGTATNGTSTFASAPVTIANLPLPVANTPPTLQGPASPTVATDLGCAEGAWTVQEQALQQFQWLRDGVPIVGEKRQSYRVMHRDVGHAITCRETRTNATGPASAVSAPVTPVAAGPFPLSPPGITGDPRPWHVVTCSSGLGGMEVRWTRDGAAVDASGSETYRVRPADVGHVLRCQTSLRVFESGALEQAVSSPVTVLPAEPVVQPPASVSFAGGPTMLRCGGLPPPIGVAYETSWTRNGVVLTGLRDQLLVLPPGTPRGNYACRIDVRTPDGVVRPGSFGGALAAPGPAFTDLAAQPADVIAFPTPTSPVGFELVCRSNSFFGQPVHRVVWQRDGVAITGAAGDVYVPGNADIGHAIRCSYTVLASGGTVTTLGSTVVIEIGALPSPPQVSQPSTGIAGERATCGLVTAPAGFFVQTAAQWLIDGALVSSLALHTSADADAGSVVTCRFVAINRTGKVATTTRGRTILGSAPQPTPLPPPTFLQGPLVQLIDGVVHCDATPILGQTAASVTGWAIDGVRIAGATGPTYTPQPGDYGRWLTCLETASNENGSVEYASDHYALLQPVDAWQFDPEVVAAQDGLAVGSPVECAGDGLTTAAWLRDGLVIAGATGASYRPVTADAGHWLACRGTFDVGTHHAVVDSPPAYVRGAEPPVASLVPVLPDVAMPGDALHCDAPFGRFDAVEFAWRRDGSVVAYGERYVVRAADGGHVIACRATGANTVGTAIVDGRPVKAQVTTGPIPVHGAAMVQPEIGAATRCGVEWQSEPDATVYAWLRDGAPIAGATGAEYTPVVADGEHLLACRATATDSAGTTVTTSPDAAVGAVGVGAAPPSPATSEPVAEAASPTLLSLPALAGLPAVVGRTLTCSGGTFGGAPGTLTRQWFREGEAIAGATGATLALTAADKGRRVTCALIAAAGGTTLTAPAPAATVEAALTALGLPAVTGVAAPGGRLTCTSPAFSTTGRAALTWRRGSVTIASTAAYVPTRGDVKPGITCRVVFTSSGGQVVTTARVVKIRWHKPSVVRKARMQGAVKVRRVIRCTATFGFVPTKVSYAWLRGKRTLGRKATYRPKASERGRSLSCRVTATNPAGHVSTRSQIASIVR